MPDYNATGNVADIGADDPSTGAHYRFWTNGAAVGYEIQFDDGRPIQFFYLNPSDGTDDGVPNIFVYQGTEADPATDEPLCHFVVGEMRAADNGNSVKLEDTSDQDARSAGIALMHAAEASDFLLSDIWAGNGPPNLQAIFRGLSNKAAEFVAYLAYSDGTNDWRTKAGLPPATDDTPEPDPAPDSVKLRLAQDLTDALAHKAAGAHASTYLTGRINEPGIAMDDDGALMAWDYDGQERIVVTEADITPPAATCKHCGRSITFEGGHWIDPEADGDDVMWRETCDSHDTFTAEHEPADDTPEPDPALTIDDVINQATAMGLLDDEVVARWESVSGKHWVDLTANGAGYSYDSPGMSGFLGNIGEEAALAEMQTRVDDGLFQPDDNKTPMRRTR